MKLEVLTPDSATTFQNLGDRHGRHLVLLVTVIGMGLATAGIGLLPTTAQAGLLASVLLVPLAWCAICRRGAPMTRAVLRSRIARGEWTTPTAGVLDDYQQANLMIVLQAQAYALLLFCLRNPKGLSDSSGG